MPYDAVALMNVLTPDKVKYTATEFQWIGSALQVAYVMIARTDSGIATFDDLTRREIIIGTSGKGTRGVFKKVTFERRFSASRMAHDYLAIYRAIRAGLQREVLQQRARDRRSGNPLRLGRLARRRSIWFG